MLPTLEPVLKQFTVESYCAKTEPIDTSAQCVQVDPDSSGCLAVITTIKVPFQGDIKLVYKNCTTVANCYKQAYGVELADGGEPKCHHYTYEQLQGGQGVPGGGDGITEFQKCAEGKGEDLTGGLGQAVGQGQAAEKGRQGGDLSAAQEAAKYITFDFCICRGNMCNEHGKIDKAIKNEIGKGTSTKPPKKNEASGLFVSKARLFSVFVGAHFYSKFLMSFKIDRIKT